MVLLWNIASHHCCESLAQEFLNHDGFKESFGLCWFDLPSTAIALKTTNVLSEMSPLKTWDLSALKKRQKGLRLEEMKYTKQLISIGFCRI